MKEQNSTKTTENLLFEDTSSDNSDRLTIAIPGTPEKKINSNQTSRRRKRKKPLTSTSSEEQISEDDEETQIDKAIEQKLQECAKKNNIAPIEMKKLLRKIVGNDHVLALVKIQEEAEIADEENLKNNSKESSSSSSGKEHDFDEKQNIYITPKLTRSKFRQLNKNPLKIPSLNEADPLPDVVALISEDLHSDEEDDEYKPKEEDFASEDDFNTTASDLDSQPGTPMTPINQIDIESPVSLLKSSCLERFTSDGLFRLPRARNDSVKSQHEEIIAKRTRSKLCLEETAIETIESTFIPPDITSDMYDFDGDIEIDQEWMEFLNEFTKPLNSGHEEDDPVADPEYIAADKIHLDAEELRDVNISKKELSDLVAELFNGLLQDGSMNNELVNLETPKKNLIKSPNESPQRKKLKLICEEQETNEFQMDSSDFYGLNFSSNINQTEFQPNIMSTPQIQESNYLYSSQSVELSTNYQSIDPSSSQVSVNMSSTLLNTPVQLQNIQTSMKNSRLRHQTPNTTPQQTIPQIQLNQSTNNNNINENFTTPTRGTLIAYPVQGATTPCYQISQISPNSNSHLSLLNNPQLGQPILARIQNQTPTAYIDLTQTQNSSIKNTTMNKTPGRPHPDYFEMWNGDAHKSAIKYYKGFYEKKYKNLENSIETSLDENFTNQFGFTALQRQILDQQMRIHVQLITQNYLQIYSHPQFWQMAQREKDMIKDLETKCNGKEDSAFNAINLKGGVELIEQWEDELSEESLENQAFMDFIYHQINRNKSKSNLYYNRVIKFPPRTMTRILNSKVCIYPEYIPRLPFRSKISNVYHEFAPIESHLLAFGMEKYLEEVQEDIKNRPDVYRRYSIAKLLCMKISKNLMLGKTTDRIFEYYKEQLKDEHYNPIKYYNERKRAPKFEHSLIPIDLKNIQKPIKRLPELPMIWKEFGTMLTLTERQKANLETRSKQRLKNRLNEVNWSNERKEKQNQKEKQKQEKLNELNKTPPPNVVIHLNYIFDSSVINSSQNLTLDDQSINESTENIFEENSVLNSQLETTPALKTTTTTTTTKPKIERSTSLTDYSTICTRIHNSLNLTLDNCDNHWNDLPFQITKSKTKNPTDNQIGSIELIEKNQTLLTDFYELTPHKTREINNSDEWMDEENIEIRKPIKKSLKLKKSFQFLIKRKFYLNNYLQKISTKSRQHKKLQNKLQNLLVQYWTYLYKIYKKYKNQQLQKFFVNFKALELYSKFLIKLKMNCKKSTKTSTVDDLNGKKSDDIAKLRKANRLGESLRQMLLPENKEEANKKDAIYAYNFYEKVEEAFKNSGHESKFKKFQNILKSFDPQKDKVSNLYYKIEKLFLPDHPDLAQVFLTFLLPSEAVEIGKFFEHFMITNMGTFINKLNIFFSKQPAQMRKIYGTLNDIADDPELNMEKIKLKILPLLKGNQFLIDWFLQIFPDETPPESLLNVSENVNLKEIESQPDGISSEIISFKDLIEDTNDTQLCQLRYINGRLFYGSRILLPAKLAFMAENLSKKDEINEEIIENKSKCFDCVHGIRELGEKRLKTALLDNNQSSCDENDKSEDEDGKCESTTFQLCDETAFRMHAIRLNPSLYSSQGCSSNFLKLKGYDETSGKSSPKKYNGKSINSITTQSNSMIKDNKRKSPKKNLPKSPICGIKRNVTASDTTNTSNAIAVSKKIKVMIEDDGNIGNNKADEQNKIKKKPNKANKSSAIVSSPVGNSLSTVRILFDQKESLISVKSNETVIDGTTNTIEKNDDETKVGKDFVQIPAAWTRDEDKIILEEAKIGHNEKILLQRISNKLADRSESEILERHRFLMDLLCRLQKKK